MNGSNIIRRLLKILVRTMYRRSISWIRLILLPGPRTENPLHQGKTEERFNGHIDGFLQPFRERQQKLNRKYWTGKSFLEQIINLLIGKRFLPSIFGILGLFPTILVGDTIVETITVC